MWPHVQERVVSFAGDIYGDKKGYLDSVRVAAYINLLDKQFMFGVCVCVCSLCIHMEHPETFQQQRRRRRHRCRTAKPPKTTSFVLSFFSLSLLFIRSSFKIYA